MEPNVLSSSLRLSAAPSELLTDSVLQQLREQAEPGCVLCFLDEWEQEDE